MIYLYRFLMLLASSFAAIIFGIVKKNERYKEYFGIASQKKDSSKEIIWFHAASIGEVLSIIGVIETYIKKNLHHQVLITTMTKTAAFMMQKRLPKECIHQYLPFDDYFCMKRFFNYWQPKKIVVVESELWPNMLYIAHERCISVTLLNATLSDKSLKKWSFVRGFAAELYSKFNVILAQSEADKQRFLTFKTPNILLMPNLKYLSSPLTYDEAALQELEKNSKNRPRFVGVSTHDGEEDLFVSCHVILKHEMQGLLTILIPRHGERIDLLLKRLSQKYPTIVFQRRTIQKVIGANTDVYVVDTLGEVGLFCTFSKIAILGGTFTNIGGHNPLEPLILGCRIIIGPYRHNILTLVEEMKDFMTCVNTEDHLVDILRYMLQHPTYRTDATKILEEKRKTLNNILIEYVF